MRGLNKLAEEAAEVIHAAMKIKRRGASKRRVKALRDEMIDFINAADKFIDKNPEFTNAGRDRDLQQ